MISKITHYLSLSLWVVLLTALMILFCDPIYYGFTDFGLMKTIDNNIEPSITNDICALVILVSSWLIIDNVAVKKDNVSALNTIAVSIPLLVLLIMERIYHGSNYTSFSLLPEIKYADVPFASLVFLLFRSLCKINSKIKTTDYKNANTNSTAELLFDNVEALDILGRNISVRKNVDILMSSQNPNGAFGVAITGSWGSGKSWYMHALWNELTKKEQKCISFRPWVYGEKELTPCFCNQLESALSEDNIEVDDLQELASSLMQETGSFGTIASFLFGLKPKGKSREELISSVKEDISHLDKPIFVFMDECDRLNKAELLQVFSLIRNICDFTNLCFILSYDTKIINETLKDAGGLAYVSKMIDKTIPLERISNDIIIDSLCQELKKHITDDNIKEQLQNIDIIKYLPTLREFNRFWNLIYSDYKLQQDIFDKTFINIVDWVILELIKYKDLTYYTHLKYSPSSILESKPTNGNYLVWVYVTKTIIKEEVPVCDSLLHTLFPNEDSSKHFDNIFGIANKTFTSIYFATSMPVGIRDCNEYVQSLKDHTFSDRLSIWVAEGDRGLIFIVSEAYYRHFLDEIETIKCLLNYIWESCEICPIDNKLSSLANGYYFENKRHSYKYILKFLSDKGLILDIFNQVFTSFDHEGNGIQDKIDMLFNETSHTLELMALLMGTLRNTIDTQGDTYQGLDIYIPLIWNRILSEITNNDIDTLNILEILYDCTYFDTFNRFVLPLIKSNPERWLGATIKFLNRADDKKYILIKSHECHAIFGSEKIYMDCMDKIEDSVSGDEKPYVKEYTSLLNILADNILHKDDINIPSKYRQPSGLEIKEYPLLAKSHAIGMNAAMPIETAIKELSESDFWKGKSLRINRVSPEEYINTQILK